MYTMIFPTVKAELEQGNSEVQNARDTLRLLHPRSTRVQAAQDLEMSESIFSKNVAELFSVQSSRLVGRR